MARQPFDKTHLRFRIASLEGMTQAAEHDSRDGRLRCNAKTRGTEFGAVSHRLFGFLQRSLQGCRIPEQLFATLREPHAAAAAAEQSHAQFGFEHADAPAHR